ncbi:MAG: site-2 protease family protein [Pirellulaceae bacterium]|nr:site-2 protease family protein [Pirellulaceae bacterium]
MSAPNPYADDAVTYEPSAVTAPVVTHVPSGPPNFWRGRRVRLPLILFLLTCLSTFVAGATHGMAVEYLFQTSLLPLRQAIYANFYNGVLYMVCVLAILLTHEMGHFVASLFYRVRASLPYFVPFPLSPIGTMGAVIVMQGHTANRKQIFDIGLAGPLAGLVVAIPIAWIGIARLDFSPSQGEIALQAPLAMRMAIDYAHPGRYDPQVGIPLKGMNAWYMAGWVGLLVTGLNMLPVSQLDGGHVTYALFGKTAHWIARLFMLLAFLYMGYVAIVYLTVPSWIFMAFLVFALGTSHPPTRDDSVPLGWFRTVLGWLSLLIPIFCFVPNLFIES